MNWWNKAKTFFKEVRSEWNKVTFPSRTEVITTTVVVVVTSVVFAVFLWLADTIILQLYQLFLDLVS